MFWFFEVIQEKDRQFEESRLSRSSKTQPSTGAQYSEPADLRQNSCSKEGTALLVEPRSCAPRQNESRQQNRTLANRSSAPQIGLKRSVPSPQPLPELKLKSSESKKSNIGFAVGENRQDSLRKLVAFLKKINAWEEFSKYPLEITADGTSEFCRNNPRGIVGAYTNGKEINLCDCFWDCSIEDQAFQILHERKHCDFRREGRRYNFPWDEWEETQCDLYAFKKLKDAGCNLDRIKWAKTEELQKLIGR